MIELSIPGTSMTSRIIVAAGAKEQALKELQDLEPTPSKVAVVTDRNVASLWESSVLSEWEASDLDLRVFRIPPGEESKSLKVVSNLWDRMLDFGMDRNSLIVALGGGMVGDLSGFVASTLLRGIRFVQIPTTLLAQIDAAIGGKTGINRSAGKNLVGSFWQPHLVVIDPAFLETLAEREFRSGLGEMVKYGLIRDPSILEDLDAITDLDTLRTDAERLSALVQRCVRIKVEIVGRDPHEGGEREILNYGHTTAHAIEAATGYHTVLHGEAVAVGMIAAAELAAQLGVGAESLPDRLRSLLSQLQLPTTVPLAPDQLLPYFRSDKKRRDGKTRWILVREPGVTEVFEDPPPAAVATALNAIHRPPRAAPESDGGTTNDSES